MVIGKPEAVLSGLEPLSKLALYMFRYGSISDIDMSCSELLSIDIDKGDLKEQGIALDRLYRDIKIMFLESY